MHWATQYIGTPWKFGGNDLQSGLDCWAFFRYVQKKHYGLSLPIITLNKYNFQNTIKEFSNHGELENWREVKTPNDGDAVLLKRARYPNHIGIWIQDKETKGVLHTIEGAGAIFSDISNLKRAGWKIARYYRHISKCNKQQ